MKKIELVFRTIGERTSDIALELAQNNIQPWKTHVIRDIKPFTKAMEEIMKIEYDPETEFVVFVDADCLIFEDLRPFLEENDLAYIDCYVLDKFRGYVHMGVHITRRDVVEEMKKVSLSDENLLYVLKPETAIRNAAFSNLKLKKKYKRFKILHDFHQNYEHIFIKCAIRELRSREDYPKAKLQSAIDNWKYKDKDFVVAIEAINYARKMIPSGESSVDIAKFIENLPNVAQFMIQDLGIEEKQPLKMEIVQELKAAANIMGVFGDESKKVFCLGLSRTSTKSLTKALNILGINVIHYPVDKITHFELIHGNYNFTILQDYDGISDITVAPYYRELDQLFYNSKFILTIREKEKWLESLKRHWEDRPPYDDPEQSETHLKIRRFLRASVYGVLTFNKQRLSNVYDLHHKNIMEYFKDRPDDLLVIDITKGEGWEKLCPFFDKPKIISAFPHVTDEEELTELL